MKRAVVGLALLASCTSSKHHADAPDRGPACEPAPGQPVDVGTIVAIGTTELSGLAASHTIAGLLWTHGDSGNPAEIFSIDAATATPRGVLALTGATNVDWEDIATAPCAAGRCIYVADTGDNHLDRATVALYEVTEPTSAPVGTVQTAWAQYAIAYPDGPHNVEALFVDPRDGASYGITKVDNAAATVYAYPRTAGTAMATELATLAIPTGDTRVTGADLFIDDCAVRLLVRTHDHLFQLAATPTATVPELLTEALEQMPVADEPQGEAIAFAADGSAYFTTSEGTDPPLWRVDGQD